MAKYDGTAATKQENLYPGYSDNKWVNIAGDPAGYLTGVNKGGFSGLVNALRGDPGAIKEAYDNMASMASGMTKDTRDFLAQQEGKALSFYQPLQHMFNSAYGSEGLQAPQTPPVGGRTILSSMNGGR